ncbi:TIGR04561 family membrane protein [Williamsoniiplasma lucivorax]|uniref:Uncharacterized protein n=1 Tax=Williamsoniiplasma lucivorax TaxID=209274 RepID=A0A2S5RD26_9MOLU|nr:TIGR04561 family membrane protein [Williamsoniiplasma lucivorax]PPE05226.1 hypothetical protein ELUCI_v1c07620 [Williamsoniiplasma lucivorax]
MFLASLEVFGINISLKVLLYVFISIAGLALLIYLLNLLFHKTSKSTQTSEELANLKKIETDIQHVEDEIQSILKDRKKGKKWTSLIKKMRT